MVDRRPGAVGIVDGCGEAGVKPAAEALVDEGRVGGCGLVAGIEAQREFVRAAEIVVGRLAHEPGCRWRRAVTGD